MNTYIYTLFLFFIPTQLLAQSTLIGVSFKVNTYPDFVYQDGQPQQATSYTVSLQAFDLEQSPVEIGIHGTYGYAGNTVNSFGLSTAYVHEPLEGLLFKAGADWDLFRSKNAPTSYVIGALFDQEQDFDPDHYLPSINPFVGWHVIVVDELLGLQVDAGYRIIGRNVAQNLLITEDNADRVRTTPSGTLIADRFGGGFNMGFSITLSF